MTTDAPGDMIRMQNPNQAKRCLPEMAGAAIFIPERRIPSRTLLSFACGITAAPRKAEVLQAGHFAVPSRKEGDFSMAQPKKQSSPRKTGLRRSHLRLTLARRVNAKSPVKAKATRKETGKALAK